jgi:hypothetical protein
MTAEKRGGLEDIKNGRTDPNQLWRELDKSPAQDNI